MMTAAYALIAAALALFIPFRKVAPFKWSIRMKIVTASALLLAAFLAVELTGCAMLGGGQTLPGIIPGILVNDAGVLKNQATVCPGNALAAQQYRRAMVICSNADTFVSELPGNPFVTPQQEAMAIKAQCATDGFTSAMPTTIDVPSNCAPASSRPIDTPAH